MKDEEICDSKGVPEEIPILDMYTEYLESDDEIVEEFMQDHPQESDWD